MDNFVSNEFVCSFWQYRYFGQQDIAEAVQDWKDAGFNIVLSFKYLTTDDCKVEMIKLLDLCYETGMKVILYDDRLHMFRLRHISESEYTAAVLQSVEDFGRHPAACAFFVGDEPNVKDMPFAKKAVELVNKNSPIPAFINFFPMWRSDDYVDLVGVEGAEIGKVYAPFVTDAGMKCLAYDCYSGMHSRRTKASLDMYFDNLNTFYAIAKECGVPLWTSLLCTRHWEFKLPTLTDMRWQMSTAIAHGVKGIQWFELYDMGYHTDSPIDIFNEKTQLYYDMRKVNRMYRKMFGDLIPKLDLIEVKHYKLHYGRTKPYAEGYDEYIKSFTAKYLDGAIISKFKHKETGNIWVMFVNTSFTDGNQYTYKFATPYEHLNGSIWLGPGDLHIIELLEK